MSTRTLTIKWGHSRGNETYGYILAILTDQHTGQRFKQCGGGYDMRGAVFGDWVTANYADRFAGMAAANGDGSRENYGLSLYNGKYSIDGACGFSTVTSLCKKIGLEVSLLDAGKSLDVITVTDTLDG